MLDQAEALRRLVKKNVSDNEEINNNKAKIITVTSGKGGDTILKVAQETLHKQFKEYQNIDFSMPSEYMRRVGQSIAAASLAKK